MMNTRTILGAGGAFAILLVGFAGGVLQAEDQPITRTELLRSDLDGIDGKETVIYIADVKPGAAGGRHRHHGD
ncbi:MAG TPA: hypothetical protein VGR43_08495, partial [Dehalococcoidia bacterium]|nr:hypothetical protein [Dehalococcoidia bacterium]